MNKKSTKKTPKKRRKNTEKPQPTQAQIDELIKKVEKLKNEEK